MSSPAAFYNSLPPVSKAYGSLCLLTTTAYQLGLLNPVSIALIYDAVISRFQFGGNLGPCAAAAANVNFAAYHLFHTSWIHVPVWRLITNFFFLGKFSIHFGIRLLMIARYGVQLEKGPFERRTANFLWMMLFGAFSLLALSTIPPLWSPFLGASLVFMLLYVWSSRNAQISIYGLAHKRHFISLEQCLHWMCSPLTPDLLGIIVGHLYYFLTVLHSLAGGRNILKTPIWVHKLVALWGVGAQANAPIQPNRSAGVAFRGRSYRLDG